MVKESLPLEKLGPLDRPGRGKSQKRPNRETPSTMERINKVRIQGPKAVADYIFTRRNQILSHLDKEPNRLTDTEWAILHRLLRDLESRKKVREEEIQKRQADLDESNARHREESNRRKQAFIEQIKASSDPVGEAVRSKYTISELRKFGLTPDQRKQAGAIRKRALRLTAAAQYLGVPKSRLDTWCREGLVKSSFTRIMRIAGAGSVDARHFLPEDLDQIDIPALEHRRALLRNKKPLRLIENGSNNLGKEEVSEDTKGHEK